MDARFLEIVFGVVLTLVALAAILVVLRSIYYVVLSGGGKGICPRCGGMYLYPSTIHGLVDEIYSACGCLPYRCTGCELRFHRPPL